MRAEHRLRVAGQRVRCRCSQEWLHMRRKSEAHQRRSFSLPVITETPDQAGVHFDSIPQILYPQILIRRMLIVIEVGDGKNDNRRMQNFLEQI